MVIFVFVLASLALAALIVLALRRVPGPAPAQPEPPIDVLRRAASASRRRILIAALAGAGAAVLCAAADTVVPYSYGLPFLLAPAFFAIGTVVALTVIGVPAPARDAPREVDLVARGPLRLGPRWSYVAPAAAALAAIAFAIVAGLTSSPTQDGHWRGFTLLVANGSSTSSPYPGWYYGIPLMIVTALLLAATCAALVRFSSAPLRGTPGDREFAILVRRRLTRFVLLAATGSILVYLGSALTVAGMAVSTASAPNLADAGDGALQILGGALFIGGMLFAVFGAALVVASIQVGVAAGNPTAAARDAARTSSGAAA